MNRAALAVVIAYAAIIVSGCAEPTRPDSPESSELPANRIEVGDLRYTCGGFPFEPGLLDRPVGGDPVAAEVLSRLDPDPEPGYLPDANWHLTGANGTRAEFVIRDPDLLIRSVTLEDRADGWKMVGYGVCQPEVALGPGLGSALWALDPTQPRPDASTQVFDALVTEMSCNSGQPADGRFVGPQIVASEGTLLVIFAVRQRGGLGGGTCQSNPSTRIQVDLGEPLGDRLLLDGGVFPAHDPSDPEF